jgi:hypothetical protein
MEKGKGRFNKHNGHRHAAKKQAYNRQWFRTHKNKAKRIKKSNGLAYYAQWLKTDGDISKLRIEKD